MDVIAVDARLSFDCARRKAYGEAVVRFRSDDRPLLFDLRQRVTGAQLDGQTLEPAAVAPGLNGAREVRPSVDEGDHELVLRYDVDTPASADAVPLGWTLQRPGIVFDFWMSDLHPGRYLEMWVPAPLCDDQFQLTLDVEVAAAAPHRIFTNGAVSPGPGGAQRVTYPPQFTSLSPMLVIVPEGRYDEICSREDGISVETFKLAGPEIDLAACHVTVAECLAHNRRRFGDYAHDDRFLTYVWGSTRGMEYDGATTASAAALEHEVFHSWFGRGVKPASASDGWIDEAFTTWYTSPAPRPRQWAQPFDWSEPPVALRPPSPLARYTPRESYLAGARFFAGIASVLGVDGLCDVMAALYRQRCGGFVSTDELEGHLSTAAGSDFGPAFCRWVHGQAEPSPRTEGLSELG